jgi:hypothetical protein
MLFIGRSRELGRLRAAFDQREASVVNVSGLRGVGKTALLTRAVEGFDALHLRLPPLPDPAQREALAAALRRSSPPESESEAPVSGGTSWADLFATALRRAEPGGAPYVLVLDDAHRLRQARSRYQAPLRSVLELARASGRALHVVLLSHSPSSMASPKLADMLGGHVDVGPLPFRSAIPLLPRGHPRDLVQAYAVFGGIPRILNMVDPSTTLGTNLRNLVFDANGRLAEAGRDWLEPDLQIPARYYAVLATLSTGEADWRTVHEGVADLTTSGQVAPYLQRLHELGLLDIRRSMDTKPRSRSRRYRITDPFLAFWFRFVLPYLQNGRGLDAAEYLNEVVRPKLDAHTDGIFPAICRDFMRLDAIEAFGANAREGGSLWGKDYRVDVAGILSSGAAYYGDCFWAGLPSKSHPLEQLDAAIRETRYGFGRDQRVRLIFTGRPLRRVQRRQVARRLDARVVDADALAGVDDA